MRMRSAISILILASIAAVMLVLPNFASATLGEHSNSTESDRVSMKASARIVPAAKYTVHEIQAPSGTTIKEYVSPAGTVFAVTWRGPFLPDLRQILGSYFDRYTQSANENHAGHHHLAIREPDFVVQSDGHMRSFSGRAYVPQLLPQGVEAGELQ
jgi:hypothetical protein